MIWKYCEMSMNVVVIVVVLMWWTTIFGLQYWCQLLYRTRNDVVCHGTRCSSRTFFGESLQHFIIECDQPVGYSDCIHPPTLRVSCDVCTMEDFVVLLVSEMVCCASYGNVSNWGFGASSINCSA